MGLRKGITVELARKKSQQISSILLYIVVDVLRYATVYNCGGEIQANTTTGLK